jgi:soluble lytic murein transglycosylase-like protein
MEIADLYRAITQAAARTSLDWWLIYSVIEQESGFDERSESGCGALGLMQLMPSSFPAWSRTSLLDPANNVKLGSEFLRECVAIWKKEAPDEAVKFGLASYNGGSGYALAAQQAAGAAGQDTATWASVEPFLRQIEVARKRPDVEQITDYVRTIWNKYEGRRGHAVLA